MGERLQGHLRRRAAAGELAPGTVAVGPYWTAAADIDVPVVDLDDLIQMKPARGRDTDFVDVAALTDPELPKP